WLQSDPDVQECVRESDFYMIGARAEAHFTEFDVDEDARVIGFNLRVGDAVCDPVKLHMTELPGIAEAEVEKFAVEIGPKMVRVWDGPVREDSSNVLAWFTTDKLLYDRAHGMPGIEGLDRCRDLATYDLLYVGIARKGDSFDRL